MARTEQEGKPKTEEKREGRLHDVAAQARVGRERQSSRGARGVDLGRGQITSRRELGLRGQERLLLGDETPLVRDDAPLRLHSARGVGRCPHRAFRPRDLVVDRPVVDDRETPRQARQRPQERLKSSNTSTCRLESTARIFVAFCVVSPGKVPLVARRAPPTSDKFTMSRKDAQPDPEAGIGYGSIELEATTEPRPSRRRLVLAAAVFGVVVPTRTLAAPRSEPWSSR